MAGINALDIINVVLLLIFSRFVLPGQATLVIMITFICVLSRSNLLYHNLNMEVHSWIIIFMAILYGPGVCIFIAVMSTWLSKTASFHIGKYNPIMVVVDTVHIIVIALFASLLTVSNFFIPAMIILFFGDIFREVTRFATFHEHPFQYSIMMMLFMTVSYYVLKSFPHLIIKWVGG